jgi:hypothetical protein
MCSDFNMQPIYKNWPNSFPPVAVFAHVSELTASPDFKPAKRGDFNAALRIVTGFADRFSWWPIDRAIAQARPDYLAAVLPAPGAQGANQLPAAFAHILTQRTGIPVLDARKAPSQTSNKHRTHTNAWDRFRVRPAFAWPSPPPPPAGDHAVLMLDDVVTTGASFAELRAFLYGSGFWPVAAVALVSTPSRNYGDEGTRLVPTLDEYRRMFADKPEIAGILSRLGIAGGNPYALTEAEIRLVLRTPVESMV